MKYILKALLIASAWLALWNTVSAQTEDLLGGSGSMENGISIVNPWGGVDSAGYVRTYPGQGQIVTGSGQLIAAEFSCSPAIGDLDGDGLQDLVVADPSGWIWFYKNSGSKETPKFTRGELLPLFYFSFHGGAYYSPCLKLCLADVSGDGLLDIVVGDFFGNVFLSVNQGSAQRPSFRQPLELSSIRLIPENPKATPWGNYLAPCAYDWNGDGIIDMLVGEGTYSANNIYIFTNAGSNQTPRFPESNRRLLIAGMGREHLTPMVYDWNHDGKPDILTGDREGHVNLYINNTQNPPDWRFKEPQSLGFGGPGKTQLEPLSTFAVGDLNGDGKADLVFGRISGRVAISYNRGTDAQPRFDSLSEITGVALSPKLKIPYQWKLRGPGGTTQALQFQVLRLVGADESDPTTFEKGLELPSPGKYAMKLEILDLQQPTFPVPLKVRDPQYTITREGTTALLPDTNYELSFWVKGSGFSSGIVTFSGNSVRDVSGGRGEIKEVTEAYVIAQPFTFATGWSKVTQRLHYRKEKDSPDPHGAFPFLLDIVLQGQGEMYFDDFQIFRK